MGIKWVTFNDDGSFIGITPWKENTALNNKSGQKIDIGQTGDGPNSDFSFGINIENQELLHDGFYVKYSGFILYQYSKNKS